MAEGFVDVVVEATGRVETVPADWVGHPVLGVGITPVPVAAEPVDPAEAPTERNTVAEIDDFAAGYGIDLGEASTKAEKVAVIDEALAAVAPPEPEPVPAGNPDVQTVFGQASDESPYPAVAAAQDHPTSPDGIEPSDETPAAGDEEH
jgi:hypothetical protein